MNSKQNSRFELFDKFVSLHELSELSSSSMLKATTNEDGVEAYDFEDRYKIKDNDPKKQRFCQDSKVSKEYEKVLKQYSQHLLPSIKKFLLEDHIPASLK